MEGVAPEEYEPEEIPPPQEEPVSQWERGLLLGARSLLLGRTAGRQSTRLRPNMTHGRTITIPETEGAPGARSSRSRLRPKA